ncbi:unnamed protein product [Camellia sinensis]
MEGTTTTTRSYCKNRRPPTYGNLITILSIDGGGVKGLISGVILTNLESQLQELDGMEARLVDYFDVIAGTSSAGLSTALLTAPNNDHRPLFAAKDLVSFSLGTSPKNFPQTKGPFAWAVNMFKALRRPKYDGKYLHKLFRDKLGETRLHQTLTNIVIPTFDIKNLEPTIFSSYQALPMDYGRFLVISVGAGWAKDAHKYNAKMAAKWGVMGWLFNNGSFPIQEIVSRASADMVDYHLSVVFQALHSENNYLRIQDDTLSGKQSIADLSTMENLKNLAQVGENLLKKPVSRINMDTGRYEPVVNGGTNEKALKKFAKLLSDEKKFRESNTPT